MSHEIISRIKHTYQTIRNKKPLILNLTNLVTMQWVANVELAVGASPLMSVCHKEFGEILQHADVLYINLGTLDDYFIENCLLAAKIAKWFNKPIVLDPVGCGFTQLRTNAALALLPYVDVVRGNASEVGALCKCFPSPKLKILTLPQGEGMNCFKGVDATAAVESVVTQAQSIAENYHCICIVTGKKDFICHAEYSAAFSFGSELMTKITGMGCALGGVLAAFLACHDDWYHACAEALLFYTLSAQQKAGSCSLGQLSDQFINALHNPDWQGLQVIYSHEEHI